MNCLHNVTYGCTVVTHGASQRCRKSRASQSCTRFAAAVRSSARRSRQDGSRLLRLPTPSLSISSTGRTIETGCCIADAKIAFTVKLSEALVERLRSYAGSRGLSLSDIVSRALEAFLPRRKKRG